MAANPLPDRSTSAGRSRARAEGESALLQTTLDSIPDGILVVDADGRIVTYNRRFAEIWDIPADALASGEDDEVLRFAREQLVDPEAFVRRVREVYDDPEEVLHDTLLFRDGRVIARSSSPHRVHGVAVGRVWVFSDVTESKRAEASLERRASDLESLNRELRDTEAAMSDLITETRELKEQLQTALSRLEAIYRSAPIGIALLSGLGEAIEANPAMAAIVGPARDTILDCFHPDEGEAADALRGVVAGDAESCEFEARYLRAGGEVAWVELAATSIRAKGLQERVTLVVAYDISQRHAAEEQLRQAQKIEAIGQLTAGIAHDFNNLLMGVLGYIDLARVDAPPGSPLDGYLEKAATSGARAASLTTQLLAFGRRQTLQPRLLDLNDLVRETLGLLDRVLGEQIEIAAALAPELPAVRADPTQLQQAIVNLALNARDAMPRGGVLAIATSPRRLDEQKAAVLELPPGAYVALEVRDTGVGMSAETRERAFEPFFTTKGVGQGSGLGLSSVFGIVKQSHGSIEIESAPGEGTTFRIYLPLNGRGQRPDAEPAA